MKPLYKAFLFLGILTVLDFLFRKGLLAFYLPLELPLNGGILIFYSVFAICALWLTRRFGNSDQMSLKALGITLDRRNQIEFLYGFLIGAFLWAIVSVVQASTGGFSWELRPDYSVVNLLYGLVFIFIADLGTELFTRGYPLTVLKNRFGADAAIIVMVAFVGLKSISFEAEGLLLFYVILIPALHTIFFSIVYFATRRLGAAVGIHTGANFITISIFDLRVSDPSYTIPSGIFQANFDAAAPSTTMLQLPYVIMAVLFSVGVYIWWKNRPVAGHDH